MVITVLVIVVIAATATAAVGAVVESKVWFLYFFARMCVHGGQKMAIPLEKAANGRARARLIVVEDSYEREIELVRFTRLNYFFFF